MDRLPKKISLVAAAAAVAAGPTTVGAQVAQSRRGGGRGRRNFFPRSYQSSDDHDRALRSDANATAVSAVPEVASIINGTATGGPRKYMVGLTRKKYHYPSAKYPFYFPNCGGTLIGPTIVITAAHCMFLPPGNGSFYPPNQVLVNLYDVNDQAGVVTINIQDPSEGVDIVVHPDFNPNTKQNDVALMFLPVGQVADYAKLNNDPHEPVEDDPLRVMGWGRTKSGASTSDVLLETTVDYISNKECQEAYADITAQYPIYMITDGMMCTYREYTAVLFAVEIVEGLCSKLTKMKMEK